jgi:nucleolar protein 58
MQKGKLGKGLKRFLTGEVVEKDKGKESMIVVDTKLSTNLLSFLRLTYLEITSLCRSVNCQEALNQDG